MVGPLGQGAWVGRAWVTGGTLWGSGQGCPGILSQLWVGAWFRGSKEVRGAWVRVAGKARSQSASSHGNDLCAWQGPPVTAEASPAMCPPPPLSRLLFQWTQQHTPPSTSPSSPSPTWRRASVRRIDSRGQQVQNQPLEGSWAKPGALLGFKVWNRHGAHRTQDAVLTSSNPGSRLC